MPIILINATAARSSGALTILEDFVAYLRSRRNDINRYYLFTSVSSFIDTEAIKVVYVSTNHWIQRIKWDLSGLEKWCLSNNVKPDLLISFQNTSTKFSKEILKETPQLVYYHQSLPLIPYPWNPLKRSETILFLYANFYKYFVNRNNKHSVYVVQLPYIKEKFLEKFRNIGNDKVFVIRPNLPNIDVNSIPLKKFDNNKIRLFYPAVPYPYKNHKVVLEALANLILNNKEVADKIEVIFTVSSDLNFVSDLAKKLHLEKYVRYVGCISYEEVLSYYKSSDALVFPSKLESFGMPLVEAAMFGLPIIAADLPYAHEVLSDYQNAYFCDADNTKEWEQAFQKIQLLKKNDLLGNKKNNSWIEFMKLADSLVDNLEEIK